MDKINKLSIGDFIAYKIDYLRYVPVLIINIDTLNNVIIADRVFSKKTFNKLRIVSIDNFDNFETYDDYSQNIYHEKLLNIDISILPEKNKYLRFIKLKKLKSKILYK